MNEYEAIMQLIFSTNNKEYSENHPLLSELDITDVEYYDTYDDYLIEQITNTRLVLSAKENSNVLHGKQIFFYNRLDLFAIFQTIYKSTDYIVIEIPEDFEGDDSAEFVKNALINKLNQHLTIKLTLSNDSILLEDITDVFSDYSDQFERVFMIEALVKNYAYIGNHYFNVSILDKRLTTVSIKEELPINTLNGFNPPSADD